jgi:hypothetical protein
MDFNTWLQFFTMSDPNGGRALKTVLNGVGNGLFADDPNGGKALKIVVSDGLVPIPFVKQLTPAESLAGGFFELLPDTQDTSFFYYANQVFLRYVYQPKNQQDTPYDNARMEIISGGGATDSQMGISSAPIAAASQSLLLPFSPRPASNDGIFSDPGKGLFASVDASGSGYGYFIIIGTAFKYPLSL